MKKLFKKLKAKLPANFLPFLIYLTMRAFYATMRVTRIGTDIPDAFHQRGEGLILAFWHGRMILCPFAYRGKEGPHILISVHGDGELIARVMQYFGFHLVRGSSSSRGKEALQELMKLARENRDLTITPDGPRGPVHEVKPGIAQLARLSGLAILPFCFSASRGITMRSWDRFFLPLPFSRVVFVYGDTIRYERGEEMEAFRRRIEEAMLTTMARADGHFRR
jgi:lysophospholipid acyltransferase (LPLAT)-like uncharacterized protein